MIEIIKASGEDEAKVRKLPRNIRQIGNIKGYGQIYMEDYVYRFLHNDPIKVEEEFTTYLLLGEEFFQQEEQYLFVQAALELSNISYAGNLPVFSEDVWDDIYRQVRRYFTDMRILGWALDRKGTLMSRSDDMENICRRHFHGENQMVLFMDTLEQEENLYLYHEGRYIRKEGYHVYYDKNGAMGEYVTDFHADAEVRIEKKKKQEEREKEIAHEEEQRFQIHDEETERFLRGSDVVSSYRSALREKERGGNGVGRSFIAAAAALVLVLLGGVFVQNYLKLQDMQRAVDAIAQQQAQQDVIETVSKSAVDMLKTDDKKEQEQTKETKEDAQEKQNKEDTAAAVNEYLAQGFYVVQKGDQLSDISKKVYGTEDMVDAICQANGIKDVNRIQAGDKLTLPAK